jgi:hypothetical protein
MPNDLLPTDLNQRRTPLVVIGNRESRRIRLLGEAATACGCDMTVISYDDLLANDFQNEWLDRLKSSGHLASDVIVRIESPGERSETARSLLASGIEPMEQRRRVPVSLIDIDAAEMERGEILHPLQWFLGLEQFMQRLDSSWGPLGMRWMNSPASIVTAFDKHACRELWRQANVPVAPGLPSVRTYSQLRASRPERHARLFLKLRYGYSAMGAVALEWRGELVRAITTVEVTWQAGRPRMFLSKRPRALQREFEIAWLIDTLAMEEIVIEEWLPKARWNGKPFDLRIVTIGGRARHAVGRANASPFTNLNLDAERMSQEEVERVLGDGSIEAKSLAERAAAEIPEAWSLGIDVLMKPNRQRGVVLEANAFGDYLPGLLCNGETTYEAELREFLTLRELGQSV